MDYYENEVWDPSGSVLEDYLDITSNLPYEFKRTAALLREVDARCTRDMSLLKKAQEAHLEAISKNKPNANELAALVTQHKSRLETRFEEKSVLVQQLFDISDRNLHRVNRDVRNLEIMLKESGELDESISALEPKLIQSEHIQAIPYNTSTSSTPPPSEINIPSSSTIPSSPQPIATTTPPPSVAATQLPPSTTTATTAATIPVVTAPIAHRKKDTSGATTIAATSSSVPPADKRKFTPNALVAACTQDLWILSRIVEVNNSDGQVTVADFENDAERFTLPPKQIVTLIDDEDLAHARQRLGTTKGKSVMALYPDTTSFYPATIAQAPFKCAATEPDPNVAGKICISCIFVDDEDPNTGVIPKRIVPVRSVFIVAQ